jgi:hypothetical protein
MEFVTIIITIVGVIGFLCCIVNIGSVFCNKPYLREWSDHIRYNKTKLWVYSAFLCLFILCCVPFAACEKYGETTEMTTVYKIIEIDGHYMTNMSSKGVDIYVRDSAENTYKTRYISNPIIIIDEREEPRNEYVKIQKKWLCFVVCDYENYIYLNNHNNDI